MHQCWSCTYTAPDLHNLGATNHEVPLDLRFERGPESKDYHKALGHDVRLAHYSDVRPVAQKGR